MVTSNLQNTNLIGTASMQNGDFLTFDSLPNNKFSLIIPRLPNVIFFLQTFRLPDVKINQVSLQTPVVDYNEIGEKMDFEPFEVTFLVDKYTRNWKEAFNWMKEITVNGSHIEKTDDIVLLANNKEIIRFVGAWPMALSGFSFDTTVEGVIYVKASLTLNYDYFDLLGDFLTQDSQYK